MLRLSGSGGVAVRSRRADRGARVADGSRGVGCAACRSGAAGAGRALLDEAARDFGRPTIPIERLLRLIVIKQRSGWGCETLVRKFSDSLHLRRFCRIALTERVPDESTIRKLVRRLGPEVIEELLAVIVAATTGERRFVARAARIDSTVVEADIRYPTDLLRSALV